MPRAAEKKEKKRMQGREALREPLIGGNSFEEIERIRSGISEERFEGIAKKLAVSKRDLAKSLGIAPRTLATRKGKLLSPFESEKTVRAERILNEASRVFGSDESARMWINSPQRGLEDRIPIDLLDTDLGTAIVEEYLSAIKYGNIW
jgi:putative toxin-antitoxin system antitoxin component (TIGR02293 family)